MSNRPTVVVTTSAEEVECHRTAEQLRHALRELTANLLRMMRGHGAPLQLGEQLAEASRAYDACSEAQRAMFQKRGALFPVDQRQMLEADWGEFHAIVGVSLQVAASALVSPKGIQAYKAREQLEAAAARLRKSG